MPRRGAAAGELAPYLKPTRLLPTTGIVRDSAEAIVRGARGDEARAQGFYDWIVDKTLRDPAVRGCGLGDIRWMLETRILGGKCADLNSLFVGLARAWSACTRRLRSARRAERESSQLGRKRRHHDRAALPRGVYLPDNGWVPVDPADVRKVVLEEPGRNAPLGDPQVRRARVAGSAAGK